MSTRLFDPAETLARVKPLFAEIGLTRISNQTGLDRLGVPVVSVCRPNAKSNAVCQGKGLTLDAARISGVMESIETYCAENVVLPLQFTSYRQLSTQQNLADVDSLTRISGSDFSIDTRLHWIKAQNLARDESCFVPFELVHADYTVPYLEGSGHFLLSSNGLASGNTFSEAVLHGLCEVIERDAMTLASFDTRPQAPARVDLASIKVPEAKSLLEQLNDRGAIVALWNITSDINVPVFKCQIMDRDDAGATSNLLSEGYGCHPAGHVAVLRAITEAAQSRLTAIAGSRDDISSSVYDSSSLDAEIRKWRDFLLRSTCGFDFGTVPDPVSESPEVQIKEVFSELQEAGLPDVLVADLSLFPAELLSVVRVIVPGLEGPPHPAYIPGKRARAMAKRFR